MSAVKLYNAWSCPFGQRAWIALVHKNVDFEYVEVNPYDKNPEWMAISPKGLVPVIVHNGKSVFESPVCIEYVDEAWSNGKRLLPTDPYQRAWVRIWSDHINKKIVPAFYGLLMKKTEDEREQHKHEILSAVTVFCNNMANDGPFFMGKEFGMADIMLAPWAQRFEVITKYYRDFTIPDTKEFTRYHTWWKAVQEVESFKATMQATEKLRTSYSRYADGTAASEVGEAIRKGRPLP